MLICKGFDRVLRHQGRFAKLAMLDLTTPLIKWIGSFLSDRSIAIRKIAENCDRRTDDWDGGERFSRFSRG